MEGRGRQWGGSGGRWAVGGGGGQWVIGEGVGQWRGTVGSVGERYVILGSSESANFLRVSINLLSPKREITTLKPPYQIP